MEPVGLAVSVAGLATAFSTCIECFEYIQLGRRFGDDYGKCVLRLDAARLRMSRWGASVGLGPESQRRSDLPVSQEEFQKAQDLLEQIKDSFDAAEKASGRYKKHAAVQKTNSTDVTVYDATADLGKDYQQLHLTMRELSIRRQGKTSFLNSKTKWALYEKERFDTLIGEVTGFVSDLVELFPAAKTEQEALCKKEVAAIKDEKDLKLIDTVVDGTDEMLQAAVRSEAASRGHNATDWKASGNSKVRIGDNNAFGVESKSHSSSRFSASDSAEIWIGNENRGR